MGKKKSILSLFLAFIMVLGLGTKSSAALINGAGGAPAEGDTATVTVRNVEEGATVTAYQIVKADYSETGFTGYTAVDGVTIKDPTKPTNQEVIDIVNGDMSALPTKTFTSEASNYSADLEPGYWIVIAEGTGTKMYNPMLAGVYYSDANNTLVPGPIDASTTWDLNGETLYAKSTDKPTLDKIIVDPGSGNDKGDDVAIGDTVNFTLTTKIPSYSKDYENVKFIITDTMSEGLTPGTVDDVKVVVGEENVEPTEETYSIAIEGQLMTITFAPEFIYNNGLKDVSVTYSATLNENAGTNFDENTNTANLEYSNNPTDDTITEKTPDETTYHYTFEINGNLFGKNKPTKEVWKSGEKVIDGESKPLAGATFELKNDATKKVYEATSDVNGLLNFKGLDAGTYILKETAAPAGYSLNTKEYEVVITATYFDDGRLENYKITIDGIETATYTATYNETGEPEVTDEVNPLEIPNTKLSELPSTGGIGTVIFTIVGVTIMAAAVVLFFIYRKRNEAK